MPIATGTNGFASLKSHFWISLAEMASVNMRLKAGAVRYVHDVANAKK